MKKIKLLPLFFTLSLTSCIAPTTNYYFDSSALSSRIYNKFWAMEPKDDIANIMQIKPDGSATLYRYSCDKFNNYKTKNKGNLGQLVEYIANQAEQKQKGSGDLIREFVKIERYKLETIGANEIKLHAIIVGGFSSIKFNTVSHKHLTATQNILGITKNFKYTAVPTAYTPKCS
ncbi:hypothetical protein [Ursidibacter arcticus]|uniref:hypothetical protein n=1 Tax=Ursidibacter arcticus TaxID=1524965 RepID=UPI0012FBA176|nr:hypothetical protein [Ursidibacter arcticus]KAE9534622.1 hypothetical protein A1D25_00435 [Ursidibacter arcticus]